MWGQILSGIGGSLLGGLFGASSARSQQRRNNEFTERMAREQWARSEAESARDRSFQERMSSTSYQRAMADMRSAGLNPILAYSQGGASSPSGRGASLQAMSASPGVDTASAAFQATSAVEAIRNLISQRKLMAAQTVKTDAEAVKTMMETRKAGAQADMIDVLADPARRIREAGSVRAAEGLLNKVGSSIGTKVHEFQNEIVPEWFGSVRNYFREKSGPSIANERRDAARRRTEEVSREIRRENQQGTIRRK